VTWTPHGLSKLAAWLLLVSLLAACASILGIEERKQDSAGSYPLEGYPGCYPGDCAGCLDVHRQECQARSACAAASGDDSCAGCVCDNCQESVVACQLDPGCASIWQCLRDTRCDLSARSAGNCTDSCGNVIQANGGVNGQAFRAASEIRSCATAAACLSCLAPQVQQTARTCTQANGCQDCPDCFDQCLCSGEKFGNCQKFCGDEAPSAACSDADSCAACGNCFNACACNGGSYEHCISACTTSTGSDPEPTSPAACTPEDECVGCTGCSAQCVCSAAGDQVFCDAACAPQLPADACEQDPRGIASACGGCTADMAQCTCGGTDMGQCLHDLGEQDCSGATGHEFNACTCTFDSAACFNMSYGACGDQSSACEACACQQCPGELGMCKETPGCEPTFACMRATNCQGSACSARCRSSDYGPEAFAFAEALWACYKGARCSCADNAPPAVDCPGAAGDVSCQAYAGTDISLPACCPSTLILTLRGIGTEPTTPDDNPCGLDMSRQYQDARGCEPLAQSNPPRYEMLETCPDAVIASAPYDGALLLGCCRGADHTCGYFDDVTGLGCLSSNVFGIPSQLCP
jgi:hypothetical protein